VAADKSLDPAPGSAAPGTTLSDGVPSVVKAETNVPWLPWLPMRVIVSRVARHLGCAPEDAWLRIVQEGEARRIKACGLTVEGWPTSPLSASWRGATSDWSIGQLSYEVLIKAGELSRAVINDVELCVGDLVGADLLPTTALGRAWWTAAEALAWITIGIPLEWKEWAGLPEPAQHVEQAGIALGEAICENRAAARGRPGRHERVERIPGDDLRSDMIEVKATPAGPWPRVVVTVFGMLAISPPQRGRYKGPPWESIEVDSATLRQAFPKPLRVERWPLIEAEQLYAEGGSEPAARAEESMPEPAPAVEPAPPTEPKQPAPAPSSPHVEPEPPPEPERARAEPTRWQRDRTIEVIKTLYPPDGIRPKGVSIAMLTNRINKRPEFKAGEVSEDTVRLADKEIKAAHKK
jgi:hypothetical protein